MKRRSKSGPPSSPMGLQEDISDEVLFEGQLAMRKRGKMLKWRRVYCKLAHDANGSAFTASKNAHAPISGNTYVLLSERSRAVEVDEVHNKAAMGGLGWVSHKFGFTLVQGGPDGQKLTLAAATEGERRKWVRALSSQIASLAESAKLVVEDVADGFDQGGKARQNNVRLLRSSASGKMPVSPASPGREMEAGGDLLQHHRSQHIDVPLHTLGRHLGALVPVRHRSDWNHFSKLLAALYHQRFHEQVQSLKIGFEHFCRIPGSLSKQQAVQRARNRDNESPGSTPGDVSHLPRRERQALENQFLSGLFHVLKKGNFEVMRDEHWAHATEEDFSFSNARIDVLWERCDHQLLGAFLREHPTLQREAAAFSDRVLIFHRGVGLTRIKGKFLQEKLDLLMQWLLTDPVKRMCTAAWLWFLGTYDRRKRVRVHDADDAQRGAQQRAAANGGDSEGKVKEKDGRRVGMRRTMRHALPTVTDVFKSLNKVTEVCEPTFKEIVIVYRDAEQREGGGIGSDGTKGPGAGKQAVKPHTVFIKFFEDVPMADAELLFPHTAVHAPVQHQVQVGVTILIALVGAITLIAENEDGWGSALYGILILLGTRVYAMFNALTLGKEHVRNLMNEALFKKMKSSATGVLLNVARSMEEQECKESMLAFWALMLAPTGQTADELDERCENVLHAQCGVHVDFEVVDALHKLRHQDRLIETFRQDGVTRYKAKPMQDVLRKLDEQWDDMFV